MGSRVPAVTRRSTRVGGAVRWYWLAGLATLVLFAGGAGSAHASSFYWYGENNSTCWQTGQPGTPSHECDGVGEWFLNSSSPVRTLEGALNGDLGLTKSGDYCNAYSKVPGFIGPMSTRDANNESGLTGFNPSPPDTMTTATGDYVCQATGAQWGQGIRPNHIPGHCVAPYQPCGMQHYVSFAGQNQGLRPWNGAFSGPALVVEGAAYPQKTSGVGGGWGYLCPIFEDVGSLNGNLIEYCFIEWEKSGYVPYRTLVNQAPISAEAGTLPATHRMCQAFTAFELNTKFSTEIAGSANTYTIGESPWFGPFKAAITEGDLLAAIKAANSQPCSEELSEEPSKYALIGVEQGTEGANLTELGEKTENLKLYTEYTQLNPPEATTSEASGVQEIQTTLNGNVNPKGADTHYYFQYGTSTSYGSSTASVDAGSGVGFVPVSSVVHGLTPGTTYHYRIVASNGEAAYGKDQTFTTSSTTAAYQNNSNDLSFSSIGSGASTVLGMLKGTSPGVAALPGGGYEAAFQANNGALFVYSSVTGAGTSTGLGMEKGTSPAIAALPGGGYVVAFQANSGNDLWVYSSVTGVGVNTNQGMLAGTSPSIAALPGGGYVVAFQNNIDHLSVWSSTGAGVNTALGMLAGTSPSIAALSGGGYEVAFDASNSNLWLYSSASEKGSTQALGMSAGTSPSIAALSGGGYEVAFHANDSNLWLYSSASEKGSTQALGMLAGASPSIAAASGGGFEVAFEASNARLWLYSSSTGQGSTEGLEMLTGTNPSIAALVGSGYNVAVQDNGNDLSISSGVNTSTVLGMLKGTSPGVAALPGGGYEAAFQANNGALFVYSSVTGAGTSTGLGMEKGTSPAIAALPGGGYVVAFQANSGNDLWVYSSVTGVGVNTNQGMLAGTSPSIAALPGGGYVVAFQNNIDHLSVWSSTGAGVNTALGMSAGTSPSIAALSGGGYEVAFDASNSNLWLYSSASEKGSTQALGMSAGTSPSIAALSGGGYEVAFHANDSNLWLYSSASEKGSTQALGMLAGVSPSVAAASGGGFEVAFEASNARLWLYSSSTGRASTENLEILAGTNPSIAE
jgi:hypothetical protein